MEKATNSDIVRTLGPVKKSGLQPPRKKLNQIYALPLPLICHPLPAFIPHNPLSIVRIAYALLSSYFWSPSSHPPVYYKGIFSPETQSVHVTDPVLIRALWEKGFFGKGTLSRSDPSWLEREKRKRGLAVQQTSEEFTQSRREERRQMKFERALKERETIENQLRQEGKILDLWGSDKTTVTNSANDSASSISTLNSAAEPVLFSMQVADPSVNSIGESTPNPTLKTDVEVSSNIERAFTAAAEDTVEEDVENQEHLQLSPEEAFFLAFGLGILKVYDGASAIPLSNLALFEKFRSASYSPDAPLSASRPDDPFLLKYVVYHHFRSLGWVLRGGSKFSVDFLLYNRGPVFSHAEYAILVLPSYSHPYWSEPSRKAEVELNEKREWFWLHCINRVQAHVHKTLVLAYVDIPPPSHEQNINIGKLLQQYEVREFALRRWLLNRSRD